MSKIILDTNAYTAYLAGDEQVLHALATADITFLSIFVMGELYAGFKGGSREKDNIAYLQNFITKPRVSILTATQETAEIFGHIKNLLKKAGTPLPINDVWIASHAMETGSVVVTYDKHFTRVSGLRLWPLIDS